MPNLRTLAAGLAATALAALAAPAAEAASPTRGLSPFCKDSQVCAGAPASVMDANGTMFTVWQRQLPSDGPADRSAIEGRTLSAANEVGPLQTIASPIAERPLLGALSRGGEARRRAPGPAGAHAVRRGRAVADP